MYGVDGDLKQRKHYTEIRSVIYKILMNLIRKKKKRDSYQDRY